jgi:hypothetical protein
VLALPEETRNRIKLTERELKLALSRQLYFTIAN